MNRWTRVNLLLGVLLASLIALQLAPQRRDDARQALTDLAPETVETVRLERGDRPVLALQRIDHRWRLTHPDSAAADPRRVAQLLAVARAPVAYRYPADESTGRFGMAPPSAVLHLDGLTLRFGDRDPTQTGRYVQVGAEVRVIDDVYFHLLTLPPSHFAVD